MSSLKLKSSLPVVATLWSTPRGTPKKCVVLCCFHSESLKGASDIRTLQEISARVIKLFFNSSLIHIHPNKKPAKAAPLKGATIGSHAYFQLEGPFPTIGKRK